jgi:endonuclease YncB( thermonuclease family)/quercetin dioxygenase-like cupin family protein
MKRFIPRVIGWVLLLVSGLAAARLWPPSVTAQAPAGKSLPSALVRSDDAVPTRGEWGGWLRFVRGDTHGTRDMVVLAVTLKPGQAPHPPHRHAEEEIMILAEGTGTWHLDGKESPPRKGDVVYAAPWSMHGIKNTGDAPLTYYMFKWNSKGVDAPPQPAREARTKPETTKVVRDRVKGSIHHAEDTVWERTTGKVKVIDARTLEFEDGTRVVLPIVAPELEQKGMSDGSLYACGKEAAEFLRKLIGDQPVTVYRHGKRNADAYVGDVSIEHEMIVNGWALADHNGRHPAEIIARESRRGLWRGQFVDPDEWRQGKRLAKEK